MTKIRRLSDAKIGENTLRKILKYCRRLSRKSSLNGVAHYVFLVLYQKRLNGHSVFFIFVIKKFFLRNISVNINFDVSLVLTENSL